MGHISSAGTESSVLAAHNLVAISTPACSQLEVRCCITGGSFFQEFHKTPHYGEKWTQMHNVE